MEFLDIFDADFNYLGKEERNEVHRQGLWHQTFNCWIIGPDNKLVVQLRSKDKANNPNLLDISSAGHLDAGETKEDGVREIEEELGLQVDPNDLIYAGFFRWSSDRESKKIIPYRNREFCHTFFLKNNTPLKEYKLQPEELDGIFAIDLNDVKKLFSGKVESIKIKGYIRNEDNSLIDDEREVNITNFANHDNLWLKIVYIIEDINNNREAIFI